MTDYAELRAALEAVKPGDGDTMLAYRLASGPAVIRALLADKDGLEVATKEAAEVIISRNDEIRRLREALRWAAGTLQSACGLTGPVNESSRFMLGDETRTAAQICDAADAALAHGQKQGRHSGARPSL